MSSSTTYTFDPPSYLKPILHAAKHPSSTVVGLLTGTVTTEGKGKAVAVQDAIPLLHHWTDLSPMMEVSLQMAEIYARKQGQVFLGLYVANSRLDDKSIPTSVSTVANAIRKDLPQALVVVIDNEKLSSSSPAFIPHLYSSTWAPQDFASPTFSLSDSSLPTKALEMVRQGKHGRLGDFDDHAEDVKVDWLANLAVLL